MVLGTVAAVSTCTGCSGATEVTAAPEATSSACTAAVAAYPDTVGGQARSEVTAGGGAGAWGDPAIIARCGVAALGPTAVSCVEVDGIGWIPEDLSDGTRLTPFGTDPALEVLVPASYGPAPLVLPAFDQAAAALPRNDLECR